MMPGYLRVPRPNLRLAVLLLALSPTCLQSTETPAKEPLMVADRLYYDGEEGHLGLDISAQFTSLQALATQLNPDRKIGRFKDRDWHLFDVLVDADFNGNGYPANWRVSGPKPLLMAYRQSLEQQRQTLVDLSIRVLAFKPTAYWEIEGDPIEVLLSSDRQLYQPGEPILLQATIHNRTRKAMLLVRPQGGSDRAWQYPLGFFELKDAQGQRLEPYVPRCKTIDPLKPDFFFTLQPGASALLYPQGHHLEQTYSLDRPGTYFVSYQYSTITAQEWQWYGCYSDAYWAERLANEFWQKQEPIVQENRRLLDKLERFSTRTKVIRIELVARLISKEAALKIAQEVCAKEGWIWKDPCIADRDRCWEVTTRCRSLGGNAFIRIEKQSGTVLEKHLTGP